ncbi:PREDICTED: abhydrolase domain-containing protein 2 [Nicrophorus vespilloides]|uniref:Abhydrolase domain-containing protein 2 n=1 Tax=Nicrophorus vespilloides TaxID=110193 RepID=A0ABM1M2P1_NICVS|nr:PREDICTED: abhydrolase domain-containing protein 2 [Nicrophorus vespilloides]
MSTALLAVIAVIICVLFRMLNVHSQPQLPFVCCADRSLLETVQKIAPLITEPYIPTRLWGFSGHIQTILHSIVGRVRCPWPIGERVYLTLNDESTVTYDLYQPLGAIAEDDITVAIVPGIGNTSESVYIRTFVHWAQCHGYRCAVLNHVGALRSVPVTAPRIFSYGHTNDFHEMLTNLLTKHPNTHLICVGFSLGGNLVTKYMGEKDRERSSQIIGAISVCQGYNAIKGTQFLLNWQNFRRFYLYIMTENMKGIILRHRNILLADDVKNRHHLVEREIMSAATLPELDDAYTKKMHNFRTITDLYKWSSSINYLDNIKSPMFFINARDDPIVHEELLEPIKKFAGSHKNVMYLEVAHGGHLGFYEGGLIYPNPVTWLDRALVALIGSLVFKHNELALKTAA